MNEYEQSVEHFIGIYVATAGPPELAEYRRGWARGWFEEHDRQVAEKAWREGADTALDFAKRNPDGVTLRLEKPNPYRKEDWNE